MLKLNNKYIYYRVNKKPVLKDYSDKEAFEIAKKIYEANEKYGHLVVFESDIKLKKTIMKQPRIELKIGGIVEIERWDGNGISEKVKILSIKTGISRAIIKTNKGYFIFSKWNCNGSVHFNWTSNRYEWHKTYMNTIDGNKYYLHK